MSQFQQQELSQNGFDYDPTAQEYSKQQEYSSESDLSDEDKIVIKNYDRKQDNNNFGKVYHENTYTKLDQKMCFNQVQACQNQEMVKEKRNKDKAERATVEQVLDPRTILILKKMLNNATLTEINGCLSTGKQANVYYGVRETSQAKKQYGIKIYKTSILVFKDRQRYVQGEFRFRRGYCSSNPRKMVKMWAQKQLRNLSRIEGHIPCPSPLLVKSNVLVMDFIGVDGVPAPKLKDVEKDAEEFSQIYLQLLIDMRILFQDCHLIHADLSEYNLLYFKEKIYFIDVSQSVEHDHPQALNFLRRDICNVNDFFRKKKVKVFTEQQVFVFIVSLDIRKGKEKELLDDLIDTYEEGNERDEVFNKIKIHQNLSSIPMEKVQKQLFEKKELEDDDYHHILTKINLKNQSQNNAIEESEGEEDEDQNSKSEEDIDEDNMVKQKKQGGKQKYEGLTKLERKHKVKQEKREKRKEKMPKKQKNKLMKK